MNIPSKLPLYTLLILILVAAAGLAPQAWAATAATTKAPSVTTAVVEAPLPVTATTEVQETAPQVQPGVRPGSTLLSSPGSTLPGPKYFVCGTDTPTPSCVCGGVKDCVLLAKSSQCKSELKCDAAGCSCDWNLR